MTQLNEKEMQLAALIDVGELHAALIVGVEQDRLHQHGFIGIAHIHLPHHVHKQVLSVVVVDQRPSELFGVLF